MNSNDPRDELREDLEKIEVLVRLAHELRLVSPSTSSAEFVRSRFIVPAELADDLDIPYVLGFDEAAGTWGYDDFGDVDGRPVSREGELLPGIPVQLPSASTIQALVEILGMAEALQVVVFQPRSMFCSELASESTSFLNGTFTLDVPIALDPLELLEAAMRDSEQHPPKKPGTARVFGSLACYLADKGGFKVNELCDDGSVKKTDPKLALERLAAFVDAGRGPGPGEELPAKESTFFLDITEA